MKIIQKEVAIPRKRHIQNEKLRARKRKNKQRRDLETKEKYIIEKGDQEIEIEIDKKEEKPRKRVMERVKRPINRVRVIDWKERN